MREVIHIITTITRGGAEKQLLVLVKEQVNSGRKVTVVPIKGDPELEEEFKTLGASIDFSLLNHSPIKQVLILRRILLNRDAIVHAHLPRAELISAAATKRRDIIFSRHNAEPFFPGSPKLISNLLSRIVARRSTQCIAISDAVKQFLLVRGELSSQFKISVVPYGFADLSQRTRQDISLEELGITKNTFNVGTVARLVPQKDLSTLLRSFSIIRKEIKNSKLIILGEGGEKSRLQALAQSLMIEDDVIWLGRRSNVQDFMEYFNVFVLTSKYEGFGLVLLEAMQMRIPIIASNNSAIPEVLGDNFPGLAVTGSPENFAQKIISLNSDMNRRIFLDFQEQQIKKFDSVKMRKAIDSVYDFI